MEKKQRRYSVDFKYKVVQAYLDSDKTQLEICEEYGISRSSLIKWKKQLEENGIDALQNKKSAPHNPAKKTAKKIVEQVVELKKKEEHKYKGLRAFADFLKRFEGINLSPTTLSKIFKKNEIPNGDENYQEKRAQVNPQKQELLEKEILEEIDHWETFERDKPQELWQIDITSFYIKDEGKVYLIDIIDDHSRYIVGWGLFREQKAEHVIKVFQEAVDHYGPPKEVLSDNGRQFVSWHGTTGFQVLLDKYNIKHIKARPHHPQTLGKLERWHGSLKKELIDIKFFHSLAEAREEIEKYIDYYNYHRTHSSLEGLVPADRYHGIANQVKEEIQQNSNNSNPNRTRLYLVGKVMGQDIRLLENQGKIELYSRNHLVQSLDFNR